MSGEPVQIGGGISRIVDREAGMVIYFKDRDGAGRYRAGAGVYAVPISQTELGSEQ